MRIKIKEIVDVGSALVVSAVAVTMARAYMTERSKDPWIARYSSAEVIPYAEEANEVGVRSGPMDARVVITEFVDFECPYCARLALTLDSLREAYPSEVAVVFVHFPLRGHTNATSAAVAAECAARQGRFWDMSQVLLRGQRMYGVKPWDVFTAEANVPDMKSFRVCAGLPVDSFARIVKGREFGERNGVDATPTTWVNGRPLHVTMDRIESLVALRK